MYYCIQWHLDWTDVCKFDWRLGRWLLASSFGPSADRLWPKHSPDHLSQLLVLLSEPEHVDSTCSQLSRGQMRTQVRNNILSRITLTTLFIRRSNDIEELKYWMKRMRGINQTRISKESIA